MGEKYVIPVLDPPETFYWGPVISREEALDRGELRFFTGDPCVKGHISERWVKSRMCVECRMRRNRLREYREEYATPYMRKFAEANPDKVDAYNAQRRAVKAAKPVKSESRREGCRAAWVRRKAS